jgi:hypothetical protein
MDLSSGTSRLTTTLLNRNGFTFLMAIFMVMVIGIMLGLTGQSWKTIMKREREKELLFRGSQIKEAIENWYNPAYKVPGVMRAAIYPLTDLKYLMEDPKTLTPIRYLPHTYATELDGKSSRCAPDCPKLKLYEDPMTGKEWEIIKCDVSVTTNEICMKFPGNNTIIGVASKSEEAPLRTKNSFKDTALENMGMNSLPLQKIKGLNESPPPSSVEEMTKYSDWKFIADLKNDHTKIYKAYHEGW